MTRAQQRSWKKQRFELWEATGSRCQICKQQVYFSQAVAHHTKGRSSGKHQAEFAEIRCRFCETQAHKDFRGSNGNVPPFLLDIVRTIYVMAKNSDPRPTSMQVSQAVARRVGCRFYVAGVMLATANHIRRMKYQSQRRG